MSSPGRTATVADGVQLADLRNALALACAQAGHALEHWRRAAGTARHGAYAAYRAALEREDVAQRMLVGRLRDVQPPAHSSARSA